MYRCEHMFSFYEKQYTKQINLEICEYYSEVGFL